MEKDLETTAIPIAKALLMQILWPWNPISIYRKPRLLREMADSRYGARSVHDEPGTSCHSRASESSSRDSAANLKRLLQVKGTVEYLSFHKANCNHLKPIAGIKIAGRNINNLRYADGTTLMAEREEELKNLLMKVKEESEKVGLKLNIHPLPLPLPLSPKVRYTHLCLFSCLAYRVVIAIFLNSIYMC